MAAAVNPHLDGPQITKSVPYQPQVQRASLKKDTRYTRAQNGVVESPNPAFMTTRRADRHSLKPPRTNGALDPSATITAKSPMRTRKPSQSSAESAYSRTTSGRQYAVGNIGNGGRIYLRFVICHSISRNAAQRVGSNSGTSELEQEVLQLGK